MKILVVDDEAAILEVLRMRLEAWGHEVTTASDGAEACRLAESFGPDVVISDVVMPELSGLDLLRKLKANDPGREIILITAHGTVGQAVEAMKRGARDFVEKPLQSGSGGASLIHKLEPVLKSVEEDLKVRRERLEAASELEHEAGFGEFVGNSDAMREVYRLLRSMAQTDASILVTGESGTGKELAARTIHRLGGRAEGPFVAINTAAIPADLMESEIFGHEKGAFTGATDVRAGCFELADKGTLFLDEIGEMPAALQPKLLRVLEDGKVRRLGGKQEHRFDVRLLTATNRDPEEAIREGRLRRDLYYRVNVFNIHLPPLRERKGDVPLLARHFLSLFNRKHEARVEAIDERAMGALEDYPWPGNVRELRNVMERAVVLTREGAIQPAHLPPPLLSPAAEGHEGTVVFPEGWTVADMEKELILTTLRRVDNNKAEAARQLGLDPKTIRNKLKSYGLD